MARVTKTPTKRQRDVVKNPPDKILILLVFMILAFGVIMVYSASHYHAMNMNGNPFHFVRRQGLFAVIGGVALIIIAYIFNYRFLSNMKLAGAFYLISIVLSLSLFVIGTETKGATRWIELPGGITFQPSEIVKIAVIIFLSAYIVKNRARMHQFTYVVKAFLLVVVPAGIIAVENLSSAIVVFLIGGLILFVSTPRVWYYVVGLGLGVVAVIYAYTLATSTTMADPDPNPFLRQYRLERIRVWQDPFIDPTGSGYQPIQSLYAIGSGGVFGKGLGQGVQKLGFLPEPHNDIIFAVICEELGLVGAAFLLLAYTLLVIRGLGIAAHADDYFGALVATGISGMVGVQALINVAVNTNTIPTTGMQLPLISYGGTALLILLGCLGILANISRTSRIKKTN